MFEEPLRQSIKSLAWLLIAVAALLAAVEYARSVDKTYPTRTFSADGEGRINVTPDVAKFSVSVVTEGGKNVSDVQSKNAEKMNAVTALLKESDVAEQDIKTDDYTLSPRYDNPSCVGLAICPQPSISGYTLTQSLRVTVRDPEKIGDLLSGVVAKGGNSVSQVEFTVDDEESARADARKEAIEQAKENAMRIAKDAGFEIGKLVSMYETPSIPSLGGGGDMFSMKSAVTNAPVAPSLEPGLNETTVNVTLTYEIL
jgi:uncharacterized protein YggE